LQWVENIERSDLTLWERINNLEKITNAYAKVNHIKPQEISISDLSILIGCVKSHAMNYKIILEADEELKCLIAENKIKNLEKAALISGIKSHEVRLQAIVACINGATLKQLKLMVEQYRRVNSSKSLIEKRGRQTKTVNFGVTNNVSVAKVVIESILNNSALGHITPPFKNIDWHNHRSLSTTFKQLLKTLEKAYG